ncbi:MAG: GTPase HflX [gamma proteobacterium symbiont of Bathyaustriella thionipta]|nr:GTPase HflX [gamma proteobacterium symbiont of Bathyaustriella thionipta]
MEFFERPDDAGDHVLIVHLDTGRADEQLANQEFIDLVRSTGADIVAEMGGVLRRPDAKHLIGSGKAAEIAEQVEIEQPDLVIFDHTLSPSQERNLERILQCRVLDRTGLILDIFSRRAQSAEGQLQVELAQLKHLSTRLVRGWTHLERQKGGIGLRGPGETQLETDRRLIGARITRIEQRLQKVVSRRELGKEARRLAEMPVVALVGYTNAGKSTLFNRLTEAKVLVQDQLFATLDPTLRRLALPQGIQVIVADTVGFISDLPHDLVAAFRSTLDETRSADLLLHVVDASNRAYGEQISEVQKVLTQIGADQVPQLLLMNKIDQLADEADRQTLSHFSDQQSIMLSAHTGEGKEELLTIIAQHFLRKRPLRKVKLKPEESCVRAKIYKNGSVLEEKIDSDGIIKLRFQMTDRHYNSLRKQHADIFDAE